MSATGPSDAARPAIAVLDYGMGNLPSVARAVTAAGGSPIVSADPETARRAAGLVVPGVGAFDACLRNLRAAGLDRTVLDFVDAARPVLGVCLGMQVLYEGSEEGRERGLALLPGVVRRLPATVRVPHMGWNDVRWRSAHPWVRNVPDGTRFYFVHSYAPDPEGPHTVGVAEHGRAFAAAVSVGSVFATQFHPEKSGPAGLALYGALVLAAGGDAGGAVAAGSVPDAAGRRP